MRTRNKTNENSATPDQQGAATERNAYGEAIRGKKEPLKTAPPSDAPAEKTENKSRNRRFSGRKKTEEAATAAPEGKRREPSGSATPEGKRREPSASAPSERKRREPSAPAPVEKKRTERPEDNAAEGTGGRTQRAPGAPAAQSRAPRQSRSRGFSWNKPKIEQVDFTTSNTNDKNIVRIMPLGGIGEIGKNMTAIEYLDEIVVIDCGLKFPEDDMLGIDIVIPDTTFLENNLHKVKGFFITHGHEDHIGALAYVLRKVNVPVYATRLTLGLIENKLREHNMFDRVKLHSVKPKDIIPFRNLKVEFIKTNHSIADACAIAVHTPGGAIVHTGDFKVDLTPVDGDVIDLARFAQLGQEGVLALMADSTNVERPGYSHSESSIGQNFEKIFLGAKGRIIVATFSSNIHRIQQIIYAAEKLGRKCVFNGRSMENVVAVARELGYLNIDDKSIVGVDDIRRFRDDQLVIMTTGSQGEPMAALSRMAVGEHRKIQIKQGDVVILSSHPIPGNEKSVFKTINLLYKLGAEVIYEAKEDVHVSGHACQEELKLMQALVKPKYFIPVHGEYRHLSIHAELARSMGMDSANILLPETGDIIELSKERIRKNGKVQTGPVMVDGLGVGDVGSIVLHDRKHLSEDGILTVVVTVDSESGTVIAGPDIISRGFVYLKESEKLMEEVRGVAKKILHESEGKKMKNTDFVKNQVRDGLKNYLFRKTMRNPMIVPVIMEI